jgi:hypothetical protein
LATFVTFCEEENFFPIFEEKAIIFSASDVAVFISFEFRTIFCEDEFSITDVVCEDEFFLWSFEV